MFRGQEDLRRYGIATGIKPFRKADVQQTIPAKSSFFVIPSLDNVKNLKIRVKNQISEINENATKKINELLEKHPKKFMGTGLDAAQYFVFFDLITTIEHSQIGNTYKKTFHHFASLTMYDAEPFRKITSKNRYGMTRFKFLIKIKILE